MEEIVWHVSAKLMPSKVMNFPENNQNFKLTKLERAMVDVQMSF